MTFPRITASIFVLLLIGCFTLVSIGSVAVAGARLTGSIATDRDVGTIVAIRPDMSFTLKTVDGKVVSFQCPDRCKVAIGHMTRHEVEKAETDVYYVKEANNVLRVLDVD